MHALETLKTYYEALAHKNLEVVADSYDVPSKMITLAGVVNFGSRDAVKAAFENVIKTWEQQGISSNLKVDLRHDQEFGKQTLKDIQYNH